MILRHSRLVALLVAALVAPLANACVNSYSLEIKALMAQGKRELALQSIVQLEKEPSAELTNDLAVARILMGRHDEAITLLKDLDARYPGRAMTAANLGTAYELKGWDAAALPWIREGIRRDPREHRGTEWVHVRILEAKLAMKKDPRWLESNTVMGLAFGDAPAPLQPPTIADHKGRMMSLEDTRDALEYQLIERTALVAPPDPVVADLFFTAAELQFWFFQDELVARRKETYAKRVEYRYATALKYGYPRKQRVESRLAELRRLGAAQVAVTKP